MRPLIFNTRARTQHSAGRTYNPEISLMEKLSVIITELDRLLQAQNFNDYCPNGLQVEGRTQVHKIVSGVTACRALIERAVLEQADMLLVHHGFFWRGEHPCIIGTKKNRLAPLLKNDISLVAYHLPLDAHPTLGNNAQLAHKLGFDIESGLQPGQEPAVGFVGRMKVPCSAEALAQRIEAVLQRTPLHISSGKQHPIERIAWCSGAAQNFIEHAITQGADAYLTGEISEHTVHTARENGIHLFAAGHHATERYGVQAVGDYLAEKFHLEHVFVDIDNPV